MVIEKYECIVLRSVNYKDNDKILTLFSKEKGIVNAQARGAKKIKSNFLNTTQILSCGEYEFNISKDRYYLANVYVKQDFSFIHNNYDKYLAACVMTELTENILKNTDDFKNLYTLFVNCLYYMKNNSYAKCLAYFFVRITEILGIMPSLEYCTICGKSVDKNNYYWSGEDGGVVCASCKKTGKIDGEIIEKLKTIFSILPIKIDTLNESKLKDVIFFMYKYISYQGEIILKTIKYII